MIRLLGMLMLACMLPLTGGCAVLGYAAAVIPGAGTKARYAGLAGQRVAVMTWTERAVTRDEEIALTWHNIGEPLLIHTQPNAEPGRPYGVCTVLIPALGARLTRNGVQAVGQPWKREREGRPFSTCALAFSESWTASP